MNVLLRRQEAGVNVCATTAREAGVNVCATTARGRNERAVRLEAG